MYLESKETYFFSIYIYPGSLSSSVGETKTNDK